MHKIRGFTLIELMIVIVIIAILASVAFPSYQNSIRKTNRTDAREALTRLAALQERYFFTNNTYGSLEDLGLDPSDTKKYTSPEEHYEIALNPTATLCGTAPDQYPCYTFVATPVSAQQLKDLQCATLSITHTGNRTATGSGTDPSKDCW